MPLHFQSGLIRPTKPVVLKDNLNLPVCFSGVAYPVQNIVSRPNGVDFECDGRYFRDVDMVKNGIEFV